MSEGEALKVVCGSFVKRGAHIVEEIIMLLLFDIKKDENIVQASQQIVFDSYHQPSKAWKQTNTLCNLHYMKKQRLLKKCKL